MPNWMGGNDPIYPLDMPLGTIETDMHIMKHLFLVSVLYKHFQKCCCINTFKKYFNYKLQNTFLKYFNYYCQLLWTSGPKYKILLTKVIEIQNTFRSHCESISQSINEYSFKKQEKHKHISRLGSVTMTVTVQCTVNKKKH